MSAMLAFREEVDLQRRLSLHPNIVRFLGASCNFPARSPPSPGSLLPPVQVIKPAALVILPQLVLQQKGRACQL